MVPYTRLRNTTCATTANDYYDGTQSSTADGMYELEYYSCRYSETPTNEEKKIVIPKERQIFNRNKITNINIKLKQQILPVNRQVRFTVRNAL